MKNSWNRFVGGLPNSLSVATALLPAAGFLLGWFSIAPSPENTRLFLSTLAGAQAGVLAIVFSVTVLGIQMIGTRYSPRMISLFTDSPVFTYTFGLFVFSIAVDLWLLYLVPNSTGRLHTAGVFAVSGLGLAAAYALFVFVRTSIKQSTPEGAIDTFVDWMTADKYLKQVQESVENNSKNAHPMRPLYTLTMNALSSGERVTAERALQEYGELVEKTLQKLQDRDAFNEHDRQVLDELFGPVLREHLHDIALQTEDHDENQLVGQATEWQYKIGKAGLDLPIDLVSRQAQYGLSDIIRDAPVDTGSLIASNNAWRRLCELLVDAANKPDSQIVWHISSSISTGVNRQLWKTSDTHWYKSAMMDLYSNMENAHEDLLDQYGEEVAMVDMEWQYEHVPDDAPNREEVDAVYRWRTALLDTTSYFLQYAIKEGKYPITEGNFRTNWQNICVQATKSPANDYAVVLCQALIELAVIDYVELQEDGLHWASIIGRVKHSGDPEIVDEAFNRILEYDYIDEEPGVFVLGDLEEREERYATYYYNLLTLPDYQHLNTIANFEEIIDAVQEQTNETWSRLRE